jgi:hypothetical protein
MDWLTVQRLKAWGLLEQRGTEREGKGRAVCKIAPNLLISEPHEMGWFAEEACPISILGQIVDLGVPRSSRGGCTIHKSKA